MNHFQSFENSNLQEIDPAGLDKNESLPLNTKNSSRRAWSQKEDNQLRCAIKLYGTNWLTVASALQNRNPSQCAQRWKRIKPQNEYSKRQIWTKKEDQLLMHFVQIYQNNWVEIARNIPNRTSKQVRERFVNKLNPEINQEPFTDAEDKLIIEGFKNFGSKWCKISKMLQGRPENIIKNRFYSYLRKHYLKIDNPYYVIPQPNQELSHSFYREHKENKVKKIKKLKKFPKLANSKTIKIQQKSQSIQFKSNLDDQNQKEDQMPFKASKNQEKQGKLQFRMPDPQESLNLVKTEEPLENEQEAKLQKEKLEYFSSNFQPNSFHQTNIQPLQCLIYYCSPQLSMPFIPSFFSTPLLQYGMASQETLLSRSQEIKSKNSS
ncbi:unnamed protein product (macronuclear) [Paramecium tetraurelia]|uniref:Myb-like DNA-binding domain protein n=1 Tax=Paramecium tetraurelia TaxID=5888 RepID=A0CW39_PARTE|nr:uncharacterized protein GSPATT00001208001 [Paramecium tetraurelia]CAK75006.1 unnamed protein product [Paramecium tetraurelia]|eukprot:XP_001442403.1 hypothetical protein (macronuclear) [Paramecium tetraurelia strain d4-2]